MTSWRNLDWFLLLLIFLVINLGTLIIFSVNPTFFYNQIFNIIVSILVFLIVSGIDYKFWGLFSAPFYIFSIFLLLTPLFFGIFSRGATRWFQIGRFVFQPSEFVKPLLIISFAKFWTDKKTTFKHIFFYIFLVSLPFFLVFNQPDLGSALVLLFFSLGIMFMNEINGFQVLALFLLGIGITPLGWFFLKNYQRQRISYFLNPWKDPLGAGYNLIQSVISVGSGGFLGKGYGQGSQSHLAFLPERHTDFIFSSLSEEFGFFGASFLVVLYFLIFKRIISNIKKLKDKFGTNIVIGVLLLFVFQAFINIGMNIGIFPIAGITLPFFSYGGSSLVSCTICLGLIQGVFKTIEKETNTFEIK